MIHGTICNGILPDAVGNWVSTSQSEQNRFTHPDIVVLRWHFNCKEYFCLIQLFFCTWYIFGSGVNLYFLNPIVELDLDELVNQAILLSVTQSTIKKQFWNNKCKALPKSFGYHRLLKMCKKYSKHQTLLLTSARGHLCFVPDKHCPICASSAATASALVWLITQGSAVKTMAPITYQTSSAFVQGRHGIIRKAVDCYVTLLNFSMTQRNKIFKEIDKCRRRSQSYTPVLA